VKGYKKWDPTEFFRPLSPSCGIFFWAKIEHSSNMRVELFENNQRKSNAPTPRTGVGQYVRTGVIPAFEN
jgi:hypothetical protein